MNTKTKRGFTLIEVLVVIGIVAVLAVVAVLAINPGQLMMQSRDANRISDLSTISNAVAFAKANGLSLGTPNIAYVSIPDPTLSPNQTSTCGPLGLPAIASTTYQCVSSANLTNTNGTGWIPIAFSTLPGSPLGALPVDPVNATSSNEYFIYTTNGSGYEVAANPEAAKDASNTANFTNGNTLTLLTSFPGAGGGTSGSGSQNIWVAAWANPSISEFSSGGTSLLQFGSYGSGDGQLDEPTGMTFDAAGNLWVVDYANNRVEEFSATGTYLSQFGSYGTSTGQFELPERIAIDTNGNIWVTDFDNNRVEEFSATGIYRGQFSVTSPANIAFDTSKNVWIPAGTEVQEFSQTGTLLSQFTYTGGQNPFSPDGIAFDRSGNIWVTDKQNYQVDEFSTSGTLLFQFGSHGTSTGQFSSPRGIAIDASGNIWVADTGNENVQEFSSSGTYLSQLNNISSETVIVH